MKIADVRKLTPPGRFIYWIRERNSIYIKRQLGVSAPWTDDEILQSYKFCNVLRINDRVSQWLLYNWFEPYKDHPNMLLAATIARQLNNTEAMRAIGFPAKWNPKRTQDILEARQRKGLSNYSSAYMITGGYGAKGRARQTKAHQTVNIVCAQVCDGQVTIDASSMQRTWQRLVGLQGFRSFIAGQVVADLRWGVTGEWGDRETWAPMGPGSKRGLNRYHDRPIDHPMEQYQFEAEFERLIGTHSFIFLKTAPGMEAIDLQGCLCEFDKYERVLHGEGRPKCKYNGKGQ